MNIPLVSAIIPTRNRPDLVLRAVKSALAQTYPAVEVVVVIDGLDLLSQSALESLSDPRLKVIPLEQSVGGAEARNVGVQRAEGEWAAFLDDDDEWMPEKIERQIAMASHSVAEFPLLCCQVVARTAVADMVWPETPPRKPSSEYLLVRSRLAYGEGVMQTSTLMARRDLLKLVPFEKGLRKHQDWDWVLRCVESPGVEVLYLAEPLAIWNLEEGRSRVSRANAWKVSWDWIRASRDRVTNRAYSSFIATQVAPQAAADNAWDSFVPLARHLFHDGLPRLRDLLVFVGAWFCPVQLRDFIRRHLHGRSAARTREVEHLIVP
jgi:glycosyltransferase involved in cell wall biosynthesis